MTPIYIEGMHGLGDNLHQRAVIRHLMQSHEVWLETPWPCVYHDLIGDRLKLVSKGSKLRTQSKNQKRESAAYTRGRIPQRSKRIWYRPEAVRLHRSVLGAMCASVDVPVGRFDLPIPEAWSQKADALLGKWKPDRPLMIYRPLVERTEWGGCAARNPDHATYAALFDVIRDRFFVVSVADLQEGAEWIVGDHVDADVEMHRGELDFETLAALTQKAALVFSSPGFAVILAQSVGTPSVCVFGGYEAGYSFSAGAQWAPHLAIEPVNPCDCFLHDHACDKRIDTPAAMESLVDFVSRHLK